MTRLSWAVSESGREGIRGEPGVAAKRPKAQKGPETKMSG